MRSLLFSTKNSPQRKNGRKKRGRTAIEEEKGGKGGHQRRFFFFYFSIFFRFPFRLNGRQWTRRLLEEHDVRGVDRARKEELFDVSGCFEVFFWRRRREFLDFPKNAETFSLKSETSKTTRTKKVRIRSTQKSVEMPECYRFSCYGGRDEEQVSLKTSLVGANGKQPAVFSLYRRAVFLDLLVSFRTKDRRFLPLSSPDRIR